jgi:hypothetical protein
MDKRFNGFRCKDLLYCHNDIFYNYGLLVNCGTRKLDDLACSLTLVYGVYKCNLHAQAKLHMWINVEHVSLRLLKEYHIKA